MRGLLFAGVVACSLIAMPTRAAAPPVAAQVAQPRAYGHVLGDVLTQRVRLAQGGRTLEPAALPAADRVGLWLERRTPQVELDADGVRWLRIDYQLINAPRTLTSIALPALALPTTAGVTLAVPAWPLSIGPLTSTEATGLPALQPDRPVALRPTAGLERQLQHALIALALVLTAWLLWWGWRQWRETQTLPFARACARLRRLDAADPAAWLALHEAINHSAGRVVHAASLPRLLDDAPQWRPLKAELERFYAASNARFFGDAPGTPAFALRELAGALRAIEKRHQR
ncbi:MAG TPA: calcium incorporation protein MxaA [Methylibium sp.]|nr:calcium incorporation protein MxaA [Methylibium sp.]